MPYQSQKPADTSECLKLTSPASGKCIDQKLAETEAENAADRAEYEWAMGERKRWSKASDAYNRDRTPFDKIGDQIGAKVDSINPAIIAGILLLGIGFWLLMSAGGRVPALAEGRSSTGPVAGLRAAAVGRKTLTAGWTIIAGAVFTAGAIGHPGVIIVAVVGAALVGWGLVVRAGTLGAAARGFATAESEYQQRLVAAQAAADAEAASTVHPHAHLAHLGITPPRPEPRRVSVPEPSTTIAEAAVLHRTGGVGIAQGSATAVLLDGRGKAGPAVRLWHAACEAAKVGTADENCSFTPAARVDRVVPLDGGDGLLVVVPRAAAVGENQLRKVTGPLLRTAGIRSAGAWEWDGTAFSIRLSNKAAAAPATPPTAPRPQPGAKPPRSEDWS